MMRIHYFDLNNERSRWLLTDFHKAFRLWFAQLQHFGSLVCLLVALTILTFRIYRAVRSRPPICLDAETANLEAKQRCAQSLLFRLADDVACNKVKYAQDLRMHGIAVVSEGTTYDVELKAFFDAFRSDVGRLLIPCDDKNRDPSPKKVSPRHPIRIVFLN